MGQRTVLEAAPSRDSDIAASRKQSLEASTRTDDASRDLAVQFLRMSRAARRAIAAQYEDDDTPPANDDERSPMAINPPINADRRHLSFEPGSLSTLPYRPKETLHNPRKHYRGSPSVDGLERQTELVDERRCKRISDGSGYGSDFLSRCKRISDDSGYGSDTGRHPRKGSGGICKQKTNAGFDVMPPKPFLCFEDYDEGIADATADDLRYECRHTIATSTPTTKKSSIRRGTRELRAPRNDEPACQAKGLRRMRGSPTLRPGNLYDRSRPQRPIIQIPADPEGCPSSEAHVSDTSPRQWPPATISVTQDSRPTERNPLRLVSGHPEFASAWSANSSRPHSAVFSSTEEHSDSATDSDDGTSSSIDSSVFSIPDSPTEPLQLRSDDPFAPHIDAVVARILQQYHTNQTQQCGGQGNRKSTQQGNSSTPDSSRHSRKRSHSEHPDEQDPSPNDPNAPPDFKRPKLPAPAAASGRHLACPFWKNDPENHRLCNKKVLSRIMYVKQHLYKFHEAPISCACCGAEFPNEIDRDEHLRARQCRVVERGPAPEGLTRAQRLEVSRRANPRDSEEEQWFAIWDVIFPGEPRPPSAYVDAELSQDLCAYREFHASRGADILLDYLAACDPALAGRVERSVSHDRAVLGRALDSIYEHWAARRALRAPPTPPQMEPSSYATDSDAASRVSLAHGAPPDPEGQMLYSYVADDVLPVPAGNLQFADRGLEGLAQRQQDVYLVPDPRALMADLDNMFASVTDEDDYVPGVY